MASVRAIAAAVMIVLAIARAAGAQDPGAQWQHVESVEGRFRVLMPRTPVVATQAVPGGGHTIEAKLHVVDLGALAYLVTYADLPHLGANADGAVTGFAQTIGATVRTRYDTSAGELRGRGARMDSDNGSLVHELRVFVFGRRLYQLVVTAERDRVDARLAVDVDRFFGSFRMVPAP